MQGSGSSIVKKVCFAFANGCPRSKMSMGLIVEYFKANGWEIVTNLGKASVIVFGCCGFDTFNEETSFKYLSIVNKRKQKDARIIVFGCLAGIDRVRLLDEFEVTPVPPSDISKFDSIISPSVRITEVKEPNQMDSYEEQFKKCFRFYDKTLVKLSLSSIFRDKALDLLMQVRNPRPLIESYHDVVDIKIGKGCDGTCSYCAIRFAVGKAKSKPPEKVLAEFNAALADGKKYFRLIADDVGAYGQDMGTSIAGLLEQIFRKDADFKIMWDDFKPNWLVMHFPELFEIITANSERIAYAGFPIQSGSEKVIGLMNRGHSVEDAKRCLLALREAAPDLSMATHALVGFPGEEDGDFEDTKTFLKDIDFKGVQVYKYCDRPNIPSALLPGKVPDRVKSRRVRELRKQLSE